MGYYAQEFIEEMKHRLLEAQTRLQVELAGLKPHTELGSGEEDNAAEIALDEVNQDVRVRIERDLQKIESALKKIAQGTYGVDANGKPIAENRLRAMPWADTSI